MSRAEFVLEAYELMADALIAKGRLEAEGIAVTLKDDQIVASEPGASGAVGGVKLVVGDADAERAREVLDSFREFALDAEGRPVTCPNCGAQRSEVARLQKKWVYRLFPFLEPLTYRCTACGMLSRPER